jgi:hypothetical protein
MSSLRRKLAAVAMVIGLATAVAGAPSAVAWTGGGHSHSKCNAGRGNDSEGCDPGNSSTSSDGSTGQNQGGDEGGPIHGGTGAP